VRRRLATAVLLPWIGSACATPPPPPPPPPAAFYWAARAPGGGVLFLLGSVHVGADGRELALPGRIELDWARAEELVVEVDPDALPDLERLEAVHRHGLLPPERTLRDVVSPGTWSLLVPYLHAHRQPLEVVSRMRPWLAAQRVTQIEFEAAGTDPQSGVDAWFLRRATEEERPVAQLETLEEQMALFAALPASVEDALLRDVLEESPAFRETIHAILWAWEHGEEARLLELLLGGRDDPRLAAFHQVVFVARNHRMAARLAARAADGRARFVVVGTGHLIGPESLPELLARYGFAVERHPEAFVRSYDPAALPPEPPAHP
jgi:uncharacterized protein YbaP (TraB family)